MKPFKHEIQKKKWDKLRRRRLIIGIAIGGCSALVFAGAGVGVGYFVWHTKTNKTPDEIKPQLSFAKGGNNELSSTVDGNEKNTITLNASFNQPVWWAGIYLTSGCEDIFEDNYVSYSNDGGATWLSSSTEYDGGVYFWFNSYHTSGSIIFKLLKPYTDDKLVNFILTYCPKENEPLIESDESASVLFLKNTVSDSEVIKDISFRIFYDDSVVTKDALWIDLNNKLGNWFTTNDLPSTPTNGKEAAELLCQSITTDGISNAASIVALIACENQAIATYIKNSIPAGCTLDLEFSFFCKHDSDDTFAFDFAQHWKQNGKEIDFSPDYLSNNRYTGVGEKFSNNLTTQQFDDTMLTVDRAIYNYNGLNFGVSNRGIALNFIGVDNAEKIYKGVNDFPSWMFTF